MMNPVVERPIIAPINVGTIVRDNIMYVLRSTFCCAAPMGVEFARIISGCISLITP